MAKIQIQISVEIRSAIIIFRKEGYSLRNVVSKLKMGVQRTIRRFESSGCLKELQSRRPRITSKAEDIRIQIT